MLLLNLKYCPIYIFNNCQLLSSCESSLLLVKNFYTTKQNLHQKLIGITLSQYITRKLMSNFVKLTTIINLSIIFALQIKIIFLTII